MACTWQEIKSRAKICKTRMGIRYDEVQDTLCQNMAHPDILNISSEGTWETVRKDFVTFSRNWLQNLHVNVPSYTWMKGAPLSAKTEGHWEKSEWTGLAVFPSLPHLAHTLFGPNTFFHNSLLFIKPSKKKKKKPGAPG